MPHQSTLLVRICGRTLPQFVNSCAAMPAHVRCPAGNVQDSAQQAADALRLKQAKETRRAAASEAERTVVQDTEKVTSIYRDTGDTIERPAAPAFARPPPPSQVLPLPYLICP